MEKNFYNLTNKEFLLKVYKEELKNIYCRNEDEFISIIKYIEILFNIGYSFSDILFPAIIELRVKKEDFNDYERWGAMEIRNPMNSYYNHPKRISHKIRYEEAIMVYDQKKDEKYARVKTNGFTLQLTDISIIAQNITEIKDENELTEIKTKTYKEKLMKGL